MSIQKYTGSLAHLQSSFDEEEPSISENGKRKKPKEYDVEEASEIIPLLASRAFHLPGNNMCEDWMQFIRNNHPLLGIFFHHRLHPLRWLQRVFILLGSISFGLTATNVVYLMHVHYGKTMDEVVFRVSVEGDPNINVGELKQFDVTYEILILWTLGGILHSIFDLCMWYLSACACFLPGGMCQNRGRLQMVGPYCVVSIVAALLAFSTFMLVLRGKYESELKKILEEQSPEYQMDDSNSEEYQAIWSLSFLFGYLIELGLVYFVYYPLIASIFFSGILSCGGCLPFFGGRPAEIRKELLEINAAATTKSESD